MTDKQIIIDDVDVNECAYFLYPLGCNSLDSKTCQCINYDCYYKQLKRKEQECETLASQLDFEVQKKECLEQECEEWQKEVERIQFIGSYGILDELKKNKELEQELEQLKSDNKHLNGLLDQALEELEQSREAIEQIKQLIQKEINDCEHCDDCESCEYNCCTRQILQICDEDNQCENQ